MKPLIVHTESRFFAGAQRMLGYFLDGLEEPVRARVPVAMVATDKLRQIVPAGIDVSELSENQRFGALRWFKQASQIARIAKRQGCGVLHGWTARDWESVWLAGRLASLPAIGSLHDDPQASFISTSRRRLMRWLGRGRLDVVVCVSNAVAKQCRTVGYADSNLQVIHNGLPPSGLANRLDVGKTKELRIGFIGAFAPRKGLGAFFEMLDRLSAGMPDGWRVVVAGGAQEAQGCEIEANVRRRFGGRPWWNRVSWLGWVSNASAFFSTIDLLVCPSLEFDPFPTVLLEAGVAGVPVLATRVGGVPEIVENGAGGWLIGVGEWDSGARVLAELMGDRDRLAAAGKLHAARVRQEFSVEAMVENYFRVYEQIALRA